MDTLHKIGAWFGLQDIDFPNHSIFSARYLLQGTDEQAIRVHFTKDVIDYLESTTDLYVEANIRHLLIYQQSVLMAPKDIQAFAETGVRLLSLFTCGREEH